FTALLHHVDIELLRESFFALKRDAAPGVDGVTWDDYAAGLDTKLVDLHGRVHRGAYRAQPSRRQYIPKPDGRQRPLGIAALEDKIVQRALAEVLNAIYEEDFLGFSYGFRPGRGQHDALDALAVAIERKTVNWILDADIQAFFDTVSHDWLIRFVEHRVGDQRVIRLIRKWLTAGVSEDGERKATTVGTPQGAVISPLLANVYLHYVFDLWAHRWRNNEARGDAIFVRYADDIVAGFAHEADATRFQAAMAERLQKFRLTLHPTKTRTVEFGRRAAADRQRRGQAKPETFDFLGFTHICGRSRAGRFQLRRKTRRDRMRATLAKIKEALRRHLHAPIPEQGSWLRHVVQGYFAYHAVPTNGRALCVFRNRVCITWLRALRRRSQRQALTWTKMARLKNQWLPRPRIQHPWPTQRFDVTHSRREPDALIGPVRFCAGAPRERRPYRDIRFLLGLGRHREAQVGELHRMATDDREARASVPDRGEDAMLSVRAVRLDEDVELVQEVVDWEGGVGGAITPMAAAVVPPAVATPSRDGARPVRRGIGTRAPTGWRTRRRYGESDPSRCR
ncbi:MAG: group II intron reverse transcriptase/maturase, partial [Alphaproteobacteria bacterium]|nr:group II intron reverse transcriptase/maturase [Alphaproteobacteria bacterium]